MKHFDVYVWMSDDYSEERKLKYQFSLKARTAYLARQKAAEELGFSGWRVNDIEVEETKEVA